MDRSTERMYKLAVVKEPGFTDNVLIRQTLDEYRKKYGARLFINTPDSGHSAVISHCRDEDIPCRRFEAKYYKHGRAAVQKRNAFMVYSSDAVLILRHEDARFQRMVRFAEHRGMPAHIVMQEEPFDNQHYTNLLRKKVKS